MKIVAHRGLHDEHPENSLEALLAAWDAGIHWCECDVRGSLEHEPVLLHDESLDRTTTGSGLLARTSSAVIHSLNLRRQDGLVARARPPHLVPVIGSMPADARLLVEIKPGVSREVVLRVVEVLVAERCIVQSFDTNVLWTAFAARAEARFELLVEDAAQPIPSGPWRGVNADFRTLTTDVVRRLRDQDYAVGAWTVNADADIRRILALGVDPIITDEPLRVRDICREIG